MSMNLGRHLDAVVHQQLFGQTTDIRMTPKYSTNFTACLLVDVRLAELGWTRVSTERDQSLTAVTLQHRDGRRMIAEGIDQYEATCRAAISAAVMRESEPQSKRRDQ